MDEARRTESKQRRATPVEVVLENTVDDDFKVKSMIRSPDERVNRKGKGYLLTSNMSTTPSPRRNNQETYSKTGVMFETSDVSLQMNAVIRTTKDEISSKASHHTCHPNKNVDGTNGEEALHSSRHHDFEGMPSNKTTSGDIVYNSVEADTSGKNSAFSPTTLSLEEYQRRGKKKRKATPRSAVMESLNFEQQRFSRMKSAPQRSPHSPRGPDIGESSKEVSHPNLVIDANKTLLSQHSGSTNETNWKAHNISKTISLKKEEERIQKNIWNNPLSPLPKIGDHQPVIDRTTTTHLGKGSTGFESEPGKSLMNEPSQSFIKESSFNNYNRPINSKPCLHSAIMKAPLVNDGVATKDSPEEARGHLGRLPGNTPLSDDSKVVSSESATRVVPKTVPGGVTFDIRPDGLSYYFMDAHENQDIEYVLPRCLKRQLQDRVKEIRCDPEQKNTSINANLEKLELTRKRKSDAFEARHEAVQHRRKELLNGQQLKIIVGMDCKQLKAQHNRGMMQKKRQNILQLVHERRNTARARKKILMDIRKGKPLEKVTSGEEKELNLPIEDVRVQDWAVKLCGGERVMQEKKEKKDVGMTDQVEGQGGEEEENDGDESMNNDGGRHIKDGENDDGRMNEPYNGNECDTDNVHTGNNRCNHVGSEAHYEIAQNEIGTNQHEDTEHTDNTVQAEEGINSAGGPDAQPDLASAAQNELGIGLLVNQPPSTERRDSHVEALSYYMATIRGVHDEVEDYAATRPDGNRVVHGEAPQAQGDYYDDRDETTSETDDDQEYIVETEEIEDLEGVLVRRNENVGSRRCRNMTYIIGTN